MAEQQVTVRFETTSGTAEKEPILLSGPIEIFASVDRLYDEDGIARPTFDDLNNIEYQEDGVFDFDLYSRENPNVKIGLLSPYLVELAENELRETNKQVIVFVEDVFAQNDTQTHRGAYFFYQGYVQDSNGMRYGKWQEILLGTHSHENIEVLDKLQSLPYEDFPESFIMTTGDGNFKLVSTKDFTGGSLPELPIEIRSQIESNKKYDEPTDAEYHHLDAPLDDLKNTYDWLKVDEYGYYTNLAVGNCRDVYRELIKANKKLYIVKKNGKYTLSRAPGRAYLQLEAFNVNYNPNYLYDDAINVVQDKIDTSHLLLNLDFDYNILENDILFLFDGDEGTLLSANDYEVLRNSPRKIIVLLNKFHFNYTAPRKLTVLVVKDSVGITCLKTDLAADFASGDLDLYEINNELIKLYIEGEFSRKTKIPQLYLTTDEYGRVNWSNKLLPAQYFCVKKKCIKKEDIPENEYDILIRFSDVNYVVEEDFPLLMIDDRFVFDECNYRISSGIDIVYKFPMDDKPGNDDGFGISRTEDETVITLVLIKKSSAGSIADEVARNYVSKEDAVAILSHGRIKLDDYAKHSDLLEFANLRHTHSQYALKNHNHDYRYANFNHTHPELLEATAHIIADAIGGNLSEVNNELSRLSEETKNKYLTYINGLIERAGIILNRDETGAISEAVIPDENIGLSPEAIQTINRTLAEDNLSGLSLHSGSSVKDAIVALALLFQKDTVKDTQVILDDPIRVNRDIGGIKKGKVYKKDTPLRTILTDLLNPFISKADAYRILRPTDVELEWYVLASDGENYTPINEKRLLRFDIEADPVLYFKVISPKNEYGNCTLDTNYLGENVIQEIKLTVKDEENIEYHRYEINDLELENLASINFEWIPKFGNHEGEIFDNYGYDSYQGIEKQTLLITPSLQYAAPDIFIGTYNTTIIDNDIIKLQKLNNIKTAFAGDEFVHCINDINTENKFILLIVRNSFLEDNSVLITNLLMNSRIENYFYPIAADTPDGMLDFSEEHDGPYIYTVYCYEVLSTNFKKLPLKFKLTNNNANNGGSNVISC